MGAADWKRPRRVKGKEKAHRNGYITGPAAGFLPAAGPVWVGRDPAAAQFLCEIHGFFPLGTPCPIAMLYPQGRLIWHLPCQTERAPWGWTVPTPKTRRSSGYTLGSSGLDP